MRPRTVSSCVSPGIPSGSRSPPVLVWPTRRPGCPAGAGSSLPSPACSNFSPMLLQRSCVSPAYSRWTAASCVLPVTRSRCPLVGPNPVRAPILVEFPPPPLKGQSSRLVLVLPPVARKSRATDLREVPLLSFPFLSLHLLARACGKGGHQTGSGMSAQPCPA